jgi:hypothetical protein
MTCPHCEPECTIDEPCVCKCHDEETEAVVFENQIIEYEVDSHLPDGSVITKKRIMVTGRTTAEAHEQFSNVWSRVS